MDFTALKDFHSKELGSDYTKGLSYTARDPADIPKGMPTKQAERLREQRSKLMELLPKWISEGKVAVGRVAEARISGRE